MRNISETPVVISPREHRPLDPSLLEAGRRVLEKYGYERMTLERIAREVGLSRVTLHRRGVSKDAIVEALAERALAGYRDSLWPALTARGTARERFELALEGLCASAEENLALLVALGTRSDAVFHEHGAERLTRAVFTEPLERLLRDGIADGTLRTRDPVESATVVFNLVGWSYLHLRTGHGWPPDRARTATLEVVLHGVAADRPDRP